jgi:hypothetical protein
MTITTFNVLTGLAYLTLVVVASWVSWKKGEKEGSVFMLKYLRELKFMKHIRTELLIDKINEVSPKELKKNEKED